MEMSRDDKQGDLAGRQTVSADRVDDMPHYVCDLEAMPVVVHRKRFHFARCNAIHERMQAAFNK